MRRVAQVIARVARSASLIVVHGGGREIDLALAEAGIARRQIDGLRITDERTLQVVVSVLAGSVNTRFVAAINAAGGHAVGLTGADAGVGLVRQAKPHRATNGELVELGLVGEPVATGGVPLIEALLRTAFTPVIACIGRARDGRLYNVNADTLAASIAGRVGAARVVFAGGTAGVLDEGNQTVAHLDAKGIDALIASGTASAGMVAKLRACQHALAANIDDVAIVDGRSAALAAVVKGTARTRGAWTRVS